MLSKVPQQNFKMFIYVFVIKILKHMNTNLEHYGFLIVKTGIANIKFEL